VFNFGNRQPEPKAPKIRFRCPSCSQLHAGFPAPAFAMPDEIFALSSDERDERCDGTPDACQLDDRFFLRCVLEMTLRDCDEHFEFGPWVEVAKVDLMRYAACEEQGVAMNSPIIGTVANELLGYESTLGVLCEIHSNPNHDLRPLVTITEPMHRLHIEQRDGITVPRAMELVAGMKGFVVIVD
jgi:hypothetical protein